ncbi:MAG: ATP synthase F1 subunit delta [Bdellovibrionales bacterium]
MTEHSQASKVAGPAAELARRYAAALYALAADRSLRDAIAEDLRQLRAQAVSDPLFRCLAEHPRLSTKQMVSAISKIAQILNVNPLTTRFLNVLAQHRRLAILDGVIEAYLNRLTAEKGERVAVVTSAQAMTPEQQDKLVAVLARQIEKGTISLSTSVDPALLGGLTVKLGPNFIDASVKGCLARLERVLKSPVTQKGAA